MEITVKVESFKGRTIYRPACDLSKIIAQINGKKNFTISMLERAEMLGVKINGASREKKW